MYLLLIKYCGPGGSRAEWELFPNFTSGKERLDLLIRQNEQYGMMAGVFAPGLVEYALLKVEVAECSAKH